LWYWHIPLSVMSPKLAEELSKDERRNSGRDEDHGLNEMDNTDGVLRSPVKVTARLLVEF
jgi:hypothetical protein